MEHENNCNTVFTHYKFRPTYIRVHELAITKRWNELAEFCARVAEADEDEQDSIWD